MATNIFNQQIDPYWHSANLAAQPGIQMLDSRTALLRDMTKEAARKLGYQDTGAMPPQELAALMQAVGATDADRAAMMAQAPAAVTKNETQDDYLREQFGYQFQDKQIMDWLSGQGYKVNTGRMGNYEGQQLVGPDGNIVSVDLYHDRSADKFFDATKLAIAAMTAGGAYQGAFGGMEAGAGLGASGGTEAGGGLLAAGGGGSAPTLAAAELSSLAPGAINAGGYISQITPALSGLAEIAPMAGIGGGAAGAGGLLGGGTSTLAPAELSMTAPGAVGAGGPISGVSPAIGAGGLSPIAGIGGGGVAAGGAAAGGGGGSYGDFGTGFGGEWTADLGSLGQVGMGKPGDLVSGAADLLGGGKNLAALLGGIAGASEGGKPNTASSTSQLDPRMQAYLYGTGVGDKNSLLGAAQDWWKNNKSGMNDDMTAGLGRLRDLYSSPQYNQGYEQMRSMGQGLMNITPAGNPFTQGLLGMPGTNPGPNVGIRPPAPGVGLLSNFNPLGRG